MLQAPQLYRSSTMFRQVPSQHAWSRVEQPMAQPPQLFGSVRGSTQTPKHRRVPWRQRR
jgi:hypothetical protein